MFFMLTSITLQSSILQWIHLTEDTKFLLYFEDAKAGNCGSAGNSDFIFPFSSIQLLESTCLLVCV
jgi:hypothetical protein